jgi:putative tryptophan/tyrosine transport system substrate-binding protein
MKRREFIATLGGAAALPFSARAQQRLPRIGVIEAIKENDSEGRARVGGFRDGLAKLGWVDGRTARIEYRWGAIDLDLARAYAAELSAMPVDVMFVASAPTVAAVRDEVHAIPIVFMQSGDPVRADSVQSMSRPGGNLTGFMQYVPSISTKYLQLLKEIAPNVTRVAVMQFDHSTWRGDFTAIQSVAGALGVTPISAVVASDAEIEQAIAALAREPNGGLITPPDTDTILRRDLIMGLARRYKLPDVYPSRVWSLAGGLISYGADIVDLYSRAASYVDRILKGAKPIDLPVQAPTKFQLVINLKTAKALGLTVPPSLLAIADEVIE